MKPLFCPKCRRKIEPPKFLFNSNIKSAGGIAIQCGWPKCTGKVKIKGEQQTEES